MKGVGIRGEENGTSWNLQRRFYEEDCDAEFEIARPHECDEPFATGIASLLIFE